jgi:hypothetical protein
MDEQLGLGFNPQGECSGTAFNFIHSASPLVGEVFHYRPRLIQGETIFRLKNFIFGEAEIELPPSDQCLLDVDHPLQKNSPTDFFSRKS